MTQEKPGGIGDGIRTGIGILSAFKQAVEETVEEAIRRGDLSPERASSLVKDAADRVQNTLVDVRERLDVVPRKEFDKLRDELDQLRLRVEQLEGGGSSPVYALPTETLPVD